MTQQFHPGQTVPQSGIYRITHRPEHPDISLEVILVKGRQFPTCQHCKSISFELFYAAQHVEEVEHLQEGDFIPAGLQGLSTET